MYILYILYYTDSDRYLYYIYYACVCILHVCVLCTCAYYARVRIMHVCVLCTCAYYARVRILHVCVSCTCVYHVQVYIDCICIMSMKCISVLTTSSFIRTVSTFHMVSHRHHNCMYIDVNKLLHYITVLYSVQNNKRG